MSLIFNLDKIRCFSFQENVLIGSYERFEKDWYQFINGDIESKYFIFDMSGMTVINSKSLGLIIGTIEQFKLENKVLLLTEISKPLQDILVISKIAGVLEVFDKLENAINYLLRNYYYFNENDTCKTQGFEP